MYGKDSWQFWAFVVGAWLVFPLTCAWLMVTHPGRVALITKRVLLGDWKTL